MEVKLTSIDFSHQGTTDLHVEAHGFKSWVPNLPIVPLGILTTNITYCLIPYTVFPQIVYAITINLEH